ncbi:hypothetical protein [Methylomonas rapida]|uniref:Uncharacterized protein n=1 Tax=Methylomonas rapida TaxID=2963939 RepID=A0ABY7GGQ3_9GAMM|nr:hypothetical protein [Methylomonas rapida]WAR44424.1 hypothetical protein NM686_019025 [Methylomonas rapida]
MKPQYLIAAALLFGANIDAVHAYGNGSSSSKCVKPTFSEFQPSANKYLQSFREFSFVASANTTPTSIEVNVSAGQYKQHIGAKELEITSKPSGQFEVTGKIDRPFQHGFIHISLTAHSKPGCEKTEGYLIRVQ